jgi:glycosyltransferase involved in cell wall biosynthesis
MPDYFHPLRVAIDGNEANCVNRVGSNAYAYHLLSAMVEVVMTRRKGFYLTILLAKPPVADMPSERPGLRYVVIRPAKLWTQLALPIYLFCNAQDFDVFFTPGHYAPRLTNLPYICAVMDLAFLQYPQLFKGWDLYKLKTWTRYSIKGAKKVVAISKYTKSEIIKYYHCEAEKIILAQPGFGMKPLIFSRQQCARLLAEMGIGQRYFLYLGTLQPRKNILRILQAFEIFIAKNSRSVYGKYLLVLAGKTGWLTQEISQAIELSPVRRQIIITGFVSEEQKAALLTAATAVCNLGIYEGFGIPALEALAYHSVPIYANNTSLPEVVGAAGIGVNPFSVTKIARALAKATSLSVTERRELGKLADIQVNKFSYEKSANQILTALLRLI